MNLRHAAALALVGLYLMTPPISYGDLNENAPCGPDCPNDYFSRAERGQPRGNRPRGRMAAQERLQRCRYRYTIAKYS